MAEQPAALTPDERAELQRLRTEVATLRERSSGRAGRAGRWVAAVALLLVAALLFAVSTLAIFVRTQLLDTERYVQTVAPLIRDPAIQTAITDRITNAIVDQLDLDKLAKDLAKALEERGAPSEISLLVSPAVSGLTSFIRSTVAKVVTSERFAQAWDNAQRVAHEELDALLTTGEGQFLTANGTEVSLNLGAVVELVKQDLINAGFSLASKIPPTNLSLPLFQSEQLPKLRRYVSWLNTAAWLLPLIAFALLLAGVMVAPKRRRGLLIGATLFALAMLLLLGGLSAARSYYLSHLPESVSAPAAQALFDTETRFLIRALQTLLVLFVIVAVLCWLFGPGRLAAGIRRLVDSGLDGLARVLSRSGVPLGPVPGWLRRYHRPLIVAVVVLALAILISWGEPGIGGVVWVTIGALVLLGLLEIVGRTSTVAEPTSKPAIA